MAAIPDFQADGLLPPEDYEVSFAELLQSTLVVVKSWTRPNGQTGTPPGELAWSPTWRH